MQPEVLRRELTSLRAGNPYLPQYHLRAVNCTRHPEKSSLTLPSRERDSSFRRVFRSQTSLDCRKTTVAAARSHLSPHSAHRTPVVFGLCSLIPALVDPGHPCSDRLTHRCSSPYQTTNRYSTFTNKEYNSRLQGTWVTFRGASRREVTSTIILLGRSMSAGL